MRRATGTSTGRTLEHARTIEQQEVRLRGLQAALDHETRRREDVEKKYAKLKRRYARLERAYTELQDARGEAAGDASPRQRYFGSRESSPTVSNASPPERSARGLSHVAENAAGVIDLTSPVASRRGSLASPAGRPNGMRNSQEALPSDDFIAESPASPHDSIAVQPLTAASATRRTTRSSTRASTGALPPPAPPVTEPRVGGTRRRHLDFLTPDPGSRPRPRLGPSESDDTPPPPQAAGRRGTSRVVDALHHEPARGRMSLERAEDEEEEKENVLPNAMSTVDSDEAASIALAQYLQHEENLAAIREVHDALARHTRDVDHVHHHLHGDHTAGGHAHGGRLNHANVDPDNMTYEELLQLGEEVGDVKKERWRQVAVHVLSSMPTHHWTTKSSGDISCIICQEGYEVGDVSLTLPCTHFFHEDCVSGWVRDNNSCPLCKLEIADV